MEEPRIGVFICRCGGNISNWVDVEAVAEAVKGEENVVFTTVDTYMCSAPSQKMIQDKIKEYNLNRVVVASCSPKVHEATFRRCVAEAGLNPYYFEHVNIREQCSWAHMKDDIKENTRKAIDHVRGGIFRARYLEPLEERREKAHKSVLIIGGGIAGISAALTLADSGYQVHMVEKEPTIGGHMAMYGRVFPTMDCAQCILTPRMADCAVNSNIKLYTYSEVMEVTGSPGNFRVKVLMKPRYIDPEKCRGCGACAEKCPWTKSSEFDLGLGLRKAVYRPFPQAVPNIYLIDPEICAYIKTGKCGICQQVCPTGAINFEDKEKIVEVDVGAIIVATGFDLIDIENRYPELGYGRYREVVTALQVERLLSSTGPTKGYLKVPGDPRKPMEWRDAKKIAYISCVGSRDPHRGVPYCSKVCCMYTLKHAKLIKELFPDVEIWYYYIDVRAAGRGYEEFYEEVQKAGLNLVRGKAAEVYKAENNGRLIVRAEDTLLGMVFENDFDMVVLCPALIPGKGLTDIVQKLKIPISVDGFITEKHPKLNPVSTLKEGIYVCGCSVAPKDIRDSVSEAWGAAAKVNEFLGEGEVKIKPEKVQVNLDLCNGCGRCVEVCPVEAIRLENGKAVVDVYACNGCGACIPECEPGALDLKNSTEKQLYAQIEGILKEKTDKPVILAFLDDETAYTTADLLGSTRDFYPTSIRIVRVPSSARVGLKHILYAFAYGADGVLLADGGEGSGSYPEVAKITEKRQREYKGFMRKYRIEPLRLRSTEVYISAPRFLGEVFRVFASTIEERGKLSDQVREKIKAEHKQKTA